MDRATDRVSTSWQHRTSPRMWMCDRVMVPCKIETRWLDVRQYWNWWWSDRPFHLQNERIPRNGECEVEMTKHNRTDCQLTEIIEVIVCQASTRLTSEFHVQCVRHTLPWNTINNGKWDTTDLGECIVPCDGSPWLWLLVSMDNDHGR